MQPLCDMQISKRIRDYIAANFYVDGGDLLDQDSLLERGVIDSTGVMEIIQFLEGEFGIHVSDQEIVPENLESIARIDAFVGRKLAAPSAQASP
jgi:acyl carrier protein